CAFGEPAINAPASARVEQRRFSSTAPSPTARAGLRYFDSRRPSSLSLGRTVQPRRFACTWSKCIVAPSGPISLPSRRRPDDIASSVLTRPGGATYRHERTAASYFSLKYGPGPEFFVHGDV